MAGTSEILGSLPMVKIPTKCSSVCSSHFNSHHQNMPSSKSILIKVIRKEVTTPMATTRVKSIKASSAAETDPLELEVKAVVTVKYDIGEYVKDMMLSWLDFEAHSAHTGVVLQLVSSQLDPKSGKAKLSKETIFHWSKNHKIDDDKVTHKVEFTVDANFGIPGAILVTNKYQKEFYLESIAIEGVVHFACNSWIQPDHRFHPDKKRIFFSNKAYLPKDTPVGLKDLRIKELRQLRGNGEGIRRVSDRIYDFDVYNDLGHPDKGKKHVRPIIGGENLPYPRRCRTGRPPTKSDANAESPVNKHIPMYVPRDEAIEDSRTTAMAEGKLKLMLNSMIPFLKESSLNSGVDHVMNTFSDINGLYTESPSFEIEPENVYWKMFARIINKMMKSMRYPFKFDRPKIVSGDIRSCLRDDELGRLALAGMNPFSIERLKAFPPVSKLDPSVYGPQDSALREEHIICHLKGKSVQQTLEENKLFMLDYHDVYLPFLNRLNANQSRKAYSSNIRQSPLSVPSFFPSNSHSLCHPRSEVWRMDLCSPSCKIKPKIQK